MFETGELQEILEPKGGGLFRTEESPATSNRQLPCLSILESPVDSCANILPRDLGCSANGSRHSPSREESGGSGCVGRKHLPGSEECLVGKGKAFDIQDRIV